MNNNNLKIFNKALQFKKMVKLVRVWWNREGKIFVRKSVNGPSLRIVNQTQLDMDNEFINVERKGPGVKQ